MSTLIQNRNPLSDNKRFKQNIEAVPLWVCGARHLQSRGSSTAKTGRAELLRGCFFVPRVHNEARRNRTDELFNRHAEIGIEVLDRQINNAQQRLFERENQVGITGSATQLAVSRNEKRLRFKQRCHLTIRAIENRKGMRRIVATATIIGADGG